MLLAAFYYFLLKSLMNWVFRRNKKGEGGDGGGGGREKGEEKEDEDGIGRGRERINTFMFQMNF